MAEKKPDKKSDKKPEAPASKTGHDVLWELIGFFIAAIFLVYALSSFSLFNFLTSSTSSGNQSIGKTIPGDYSFWGNLIGKATDLSYPPPGNISLGVDVVSKGLLQVRREPGGSVIGMQKRGEVAKIVDGPISAYGSRWWMTDYESPPSGWVDEKDITIEFFLYYLVNILPILWSYITIIGWGISIICILSIIYIAIKEIGVPVYDETKVEPVDETTTLDARALTKTKNPPINLPIGEEVEPPEENYKWKHVELLLKAHSPSDWRQAIIEADVMLDDMLDKMGYPGVSIGDKLKNIENNDFATLDKAWEAHKVRNRIAHDGGEYKLSYDEVVRVIGLYEDVFKEFYWI